MLNRPTNDNEDQLETRKKAAKMLFAIVLLFAVCFFPNHLLNILRSVYINYVICTIM